MRIIECTFLKVLKWTNNWISHFLWKSTFLETLFHYLYRLYVRISFVAFPKKIFLCTYLSLKKLVLWNRDYGCNVYIKHQWVKWIENSSEIRFSPVSNIYHKFIGVMTLGSDACFGKQCIVIKLLIGHQWLKLGMYKITI